MRKERKKLDRQKITPGAVKICHGIRKQCEKTRKKTIEVQALLKKGKTRAMSIKSGFLSKFRQIVAKKE